jgi:hypothetical protein
VREFTVWRLRRRLTEEPLRRLSVALSRGQEVYDLAAAVNSSIQIGPAAPEPKNESKEGLFLLPRRPQTFNLPKLVGCA